LHVRISQYHQHFGPKIIMWFPMQIMIQSPDSVGNNMISECTLNIALSSAFLAKNQNHYLHFYGNAEGCSILKSSASSTSSGTCIHTYIYTYVFRVSCALSWKSEYYLHYQSLSVQYIYKSPICVNRKSAPYVSWVQSIICIILKICVGTQIMICIFRNHTMIWWKWGGGQRKKKKEGGGWVQVVRGAWVLRRAGPHTNNARSTFFHHLQKDKQRKQRHSLKLGKKRRDSSKRNYYIVSPRVIIKAIIIFCETIVQRIAFGVSFILNFQLQSHWPPFNGTLQKRLGELDYRLRFETEEMTLQMQ